MLSRRSISQSIVELLLSLVRIKCTKFKLEAVQISNFLEWGLFACKSTLHLGSSHYMKETV